MIHCKVPWLTSGRHAAQELVRGGIAPPTVEFRVCLAMDLLDCRTKFMTAHVRPARQISKSGLVDRQALCKGRRLSTEFC